ncbi:MAG: ATP-binding protein [Desulfurococcales archaeon]|nr:ATP-binding protein [Desulfurococcales archaeon]
MLFDPEPKRSRRDFFDMDDALADFMDSVSSDKLILVTGLRRYGKTSLILTGLNEAGVEYVFIDCRLLPSGMISIREFLKLLHRELRSHSWARRILDKIAYIDIHGLSIRVSRLHDVIIDVLEALGDRVLVLDEVQELRRSTYRFDSLLAYLYDHTRVRVVVSGSQVGMLYRFLRVNDPSAPLYGRPYHEVRVPRLSEEQAREFLELGFNEYGLKPDERVIDEAVKAFDGIVGWLTFFGYTYSRDRRSVREVLDYASSLAASEVMKALEVHGVAVPRYTEALRVVASLGKARWSDILRADTLKCNFLYQAVPFYAT